MAPSAWSSASIFNRFGTKVTIVELLPRLVPLEDEAISAELHKAFRKQGITAHTGTTVTSARVTGEASSSRRRPGGKAQSFARTICSWPLAAWTGARGPRRRRWASRSIAATSSWTTYRTNVPGISAIGDVITVGGPHPQLAHVSSAEGILGRRAARRGRGAADQLRSVPACVHCDPEIGSGLTEAKARERGFDVRVGTFPFSALGRARMANETEGFVKIVADRKACDEVLGMHHRTPCH